MITGDYDANEYRVLIVPPTRRDGEVSCRILAGAGLTCAVCEPAVVAKQIVAGIGAVILTDAAAADPRITQVTAALENQPTWSDTPVILLSRMGHQSPSLTRLLSTLTNVTILERPTSPRTLVSSVYAAIRGRRRQYQLRDQLIALHEAEEALRNADRRKDEFLAMLAHELRNPLAPIRTASELLARSLPPQDRVQAAVSIVKRQATHLTRLVDDLLDVSRITQGRIQLQRQPLELASIVAQAMESVEPLIREKQHELTLISSAQPLYVDGDSARLVQCVANLLTNASKYTDARGHIRVETRAEQSSAVVSIRDDGIGISPELLPRIFGLFVQSDRSLARSEGGLGIGLSVVQKIVEMHGGSVSAASAGLSRGATFEIRLPVIEPPAATSEEGRQTTIRSRRILIVDDNVDAATSLAECLRLDGHQTRAVYSARGAFESVESFGPEIVLLDIGLPDINGFEVARQIRGEGVSVRLVALTGYGQAEDIERAREAGFDAHMVKPVDLDALERVIAGANTQTPPH
jgi:signal transduction histidine kinase/ActR/RegA family two-component response regulator